MHVLGPALAGALAIIVPISAHANGPRSNMRPGNARGVREHRVGVGWRRFERAFGGDWGPPHSQPRPAMEPGAGLCSLGT
jgi:hypothetical protein